MDEIAITGIGIVSPLGIGKNDFWSNLQACRTAVKRPDRFAAGTLSSRLAAVVEGFRPRDFMPPAAYRRMGPASRMLVAAGVEALEDSGLDLDGVGRGQVAVVVGTAYGGTSQIDAFFNSLLAEGPRGAKPIYFPETVPNAPAGHLAIFNQITGPNTTLCLNQLSAELAMDYARRLLLCGRAKAVLVGGVDELSPALFDCLDTLRAVNRSDTDWPLPGGGMVPGEGACVLVCETPEAAAGRGARTYGRLSAAVIAGGLGLPGHYEQEGRQLSRAVGRALDRAGLEPEQIDQVHVAANFAAQAEQMEIEVLGRLFGDRCHLPVTPLKYFCGDYGAAGTLRAAAILLGFERGRRPPAIPAAAIGSALAWPRLPWRSAATGACEKALMISSTFGGAGAALIFNKS